jgi:hypothetical protein
METMICVAAYIYPVFFSQYILYTIMFKNLVSKSIRFAKSARLPAANFLIHSRAVLYVLLILSILHIVYLANNNDIASMMIFVLVGLLTSFFNKNMVVILSVALIITNVLRSAMKKDYILSEGFSDNEKESHEKKESREKKESDEKHVNPDELKEEFAEFQTVQKKILEGMNDLNPLLDKAEDFIKKYEQYKKENVEKPQEKVENKPQEKK